MKKLIVMALLASGFISAQTAIGKTKVTNSSVSLEFGNDNRGLILPYVASAASLNDAVPGTLVMDASDAIIKLKKSGTEWTALTANVQNATYGLNTLIADTTGAVNTTIQQNLTDVLTKKAIIGATADAAPGVLVLSAANKAMILPQVTSPHLNIINPAPGMMVFDPTTNQLCVFNGTVWNYWGKAN